MIFASPPEAVASKPEPYIILKKEIEKIFGQKIISAKECLMLAEDIYNKTSSLLNFNTIRRFFGLVKSDYPASKATINILSAYCGFSSLAELTAYVETAPEKPGSEQNVILLNYLVMIFKNTLVNDDNDETFNSFVKITIEHLHENIPLMKSLQKEIAKTKNGIEFYFEKNVNYDKLNSFYGEGLHDYMNESSSQEKTIFALSLLCLKNWLVCDNESLKKNFERLQPLNLSPSAPSFIWSRYFSAHLLYANAFSADVEKLLIETYTFHANCKLANRKQKVAESFEYIYANTLILTNNYEHALYYTDHALKNYDELNSPEGHYSLQKLLLLKAIALIQLKNRAEAKNIYQLLKPSKFYFLSSKLDTALYLILTKEINKGNRNTDLQLNKIVEESGFLKLQHMIFD